MRIERLSQVFLSVAFFKLVVYWIPIMLIFGKTQIIQSRVPPLSISLQLSLWMFFSKCFRRLINEITLPSIQTRTETYDKTIRQIRAQNHLLQLENKIKANEILSKARKRSWRKKGGIRCNSAGIYKEISRFSTQVLDCWRRKRSENQRDCFQQLADSGILSLHHPCDNVFMLSKRLRFFLDTPTKSQLKVLPLLSLAHREQN